MIKTFRIWLFSLERWKKRSIKIIFDILIIVTSLFLAFYMRLETINFFYKVDTYICATIAVTATISAFAYRGIYITFTRRVSIEAAYSIIFGSVLSSLTLLLSILIFELEMPRSVPIIYSLILCLLATSSRFFVRAFGRDINQKQKKNISIYGLGSSGLQIMDALTSNSNYRVCQIIDDNPEIQGQTISEIRIDNFNNAREKFKKLEIDILLITFSSGVEIIRQRVLDILSENQIEVKTIPSITSMIIDASSVIEFKDLKIEDLLGREQVTPDFKLMSQNITHKTVLVTGAGGSIGSELCRQIAQWNPQKLIMLDVYEFSIYKLLNEFEEKNLNPNIDIVPLIGSVQDNNFIKKIMMGFSIDTVYHAAAYKHVPLMEQNVMQCIANNVFGTLNVAKNAIIAEVNNFILVSTDKAVNPTNFMGASKRIAEIICQTLPTEKSKTLFSVVRFGNVLGSSGSVVPLFTEQIKKGGPITLTHQEITRYFMTIPEAAQLLIQAGSMKQNDGVFVLDMGDPIKIIDLAKKMVTLSGFKPILSDHRKLKTDEIAITVTGLRHGEKLYEELSYGANLIGTNHPRIMISKETEMKMEELNTFLEKIKFAYSNDDYPKLFEAISSVLNEVSDIKGSKDVFIKSNKKLNTVVPISLKTN